MSGDIEKQIRCRGHGEFVSGGGRLRGRRWEIFWAVWQARARSVRGARRRRGGGKRGGDILTARGTNSNSLPDGSRKHGARVPEAFSCRCPDLETIVIRSDIFGFTPWHGRRLLSLDVKGLLQRRTCGRYDWSTGVRCAGRESLVFFVF